MKTIILLMMVLLPCTALAASDCRIVEYPDHTEAVCVGDEPTPASFQKAGQEQLPGEGQTVAAAQTPDLEQLDLPPERIVRNDLARAHGAYWLKSMPNQ